MKSILVNHIVSTNQKSLSDILQTQNRIYTFLNPVSYLIALKNKDKFAGFDGIFADGVLLVKAIKLVYGDLVQRKSFDMTSFAPILFDKAVKEGRRIYIVASKEDELNKAVKIFSEQYPRLHIVGKHHGFFSSNKEREEEIGRIIVLNPDYLIVGMGTPLQEEFLLQAKKKGFQGIGFTCGGFIHQTAHNQIDYYPTWIDRANLRFVYRMYKEPHTRKRYLQAAFLFPYYFLKEKWNN